ncbi:type VII secretion protein EccE [Streptomyces cinnamoneus]|uniref:Type VII secretion protein EccE n=1 Tax=Streptomyces cinnamoneus TaxID=53446 RepID=A0A2G1XCK9_STRCJ|nr:type VII secretion protein EccE [Streptomyces cinnamoneus]PHQ48973.1 type VII secretion protein EccE [Streptomyces cinnamoneus]PPT15382.1 type VII secretion protein EccE [Streptomyces cinnamoneus]
MAAATRIRAGSGPGAGADAVVPRPAQGRGALGPVRLQQLVLIEVAAALVLAAWAADQLLVLPAAVLAVVLLLLALVRRGSRPVTEWLTSAVALRRRERRAVPVTAGTDPRLAPVVECEPALRTESFTDRERRTVGLVGDGTFVSAVLRIETVDRPLRANRAEQALPLGLLRDAMDVDGIRLESVQVVQSALPAPAPHLPAQGLATRNYAPLQELTGSPAVRQTWVALKLDPELCAEAVEARGGGVEGARLCVLRAANQLASRLEGADFTATLLSEDALIAALATAADVNPAATAQAGRAGAPTRRTAETPRAWRCDDRWHTTYWVGRWPRLGGGAASLPQLAALLTSLPALSTTLSLTLGRGRNVDGLHAPTLTGHLRICGRSADELGTVRRELERAARGVKVGLVRLDHEQVPGVLATLPLGGTR